METDTHHFQDEGLRGWNRCKIFAQQTFGLVYLQSERQIINQIFRQDTSRECGVLCSIYKLTSFKLTPCLLISSTLLILQPLQNSAVSTLYKSRRKTSAVEKMEAQLLCSTSHNFTLLVCSQKTLGTTTNLKCFSSSAHLSEFLASFSKSSSWANVPFKSCRHWIKLVDETRNTHWKRISCPYLKHPSESEGWVHELNDIQQDFQGSDITIKSVPEVDVLHLWGDKLERKWILKFVW